MRTIRSASILFSGKLFVAVCLTLGLMGMGSTTAAAWEIVGTAGFSAGQADNTSLAFDGSTPYVAYKDGAHSNMATVMRYSGGAWETVGTAGFSAGWASYISLAFDGSTPYVAYQDGNETDNAVTVMKFDDTLSTPAWVTVGTAGFSAGGAYYTSLAFDGSTPYVAYMDGAHSYKATVMKYSGGAWETVGTAGFSAGGAYYTSLAFDGSSPYVAYQDGAHSSSATVMMYNGTNWVTVGTAGFSAGSVDYTSLAFDGSTPYVAYRDNGNSYSATVMRYDDTLLPPAWVTVGTAGFSAGLVEYTSLAFDGSTPYVAYSDDENSYKATVMRLVSAPASIPTLNEWGMILLSLLIIGTGYITIRRRQRASV